MGRTLLFSWYIRSIVQAEIPPTIFAQLPRGPVVVTGRAERRGEGVSVLVANITPYDFS